MPIYRGAIRVFVNVPVAWGDSFVCLLVKVYKQTIKGTDKEKVRHTDTYRRIVIGYS